MSQEMDLEEVVLYVLLLKNQKQVFLANSKATGWAVRKKYRELKAKALEDLQEGTCKWSEFLLKIYSVEPPLTDTSHRWTPLLSGQLVMFSDTYKHYIFNLPLADTFSGPKGVRLQEGRLYVQRTICLNIFIIPIYSNNYYFSGSSIQGTPLSSQAKCPLSRGWVGVVVAIC